MEQAKIKSEVHTRVLEIGVNVVVNTLRHLCVFNPIEQLMILKMASDHISKETGITIDSAVLKPDDKKGAN